MMMIIRMTRILELVLIVAKKPFNQAFKTRRETSFEQLNCDKQKSSRLIYTLYFFTLCFVININQQREHDNPLWLGIDNKLPP